jgi:uncharacterized RDD family membrane protein YckC
MIDLWNAPVGSPPARPADSGDFVTGEAVPLDLRIAQLPSRSMAITVDVAVQALLIAGAVWILSSIAGNGVDGATISGLSIVLALLVLLGYPVAFETFTRGRSLGKMALGLRVVRDDGGAERFRHALVRGLFELVEIWMLSGVPAVLVSLLNSRGKRLGDLAAGTVVVRERVPRSRATPQQYVDPWVAAWAANADISRVPDDLALAIRLFLARAPGLRVEARAELAYRLTSDVLRHVAPPPPNGTPPEAILTAVHVERRRRAEGRLLSRAARAVAAPPGGPSVPAAPPVATPVAEPSPVPQTSPAPPWGSAPPSGGGFHLPG